MWVVAGRLGGLACAMAALGASPEGARPRWDVKPEIRLWVEHVKVPEDHVEMVRRAALSWSRASAGALRFVHVAEFPGSGIRVRFVRDDENFGEAVPYVDRGSGRIVRADVVLLMDPPGDRLQKQLVVYLSALHELGHVLGLPHADRFGDVMYPFRSAADADRFFLAYRRRLRTIDDIGSTNASGLTPRDVRALGTLYASRATGRSGSPSESLVRRASAPFRDREIRSIERGVGSDQGTKQQCAPGEKQDGGGDLECSHGHPPRPE
jgi:hypothetical protein